MAMELSPRVSFSHSPTFTGSSFRLDDSLGPVDPSAEFDFSTSYEAASLKPEEYSSTPADLLFSQGRLLPLYSSTQPQQQQQLPPQLPKPNNQQLLNIGRSSSVSVSSTTNIAGAGSHVLCESIPRSKSTGCCSLNHHTLQQYHPSNVPSRRPAQEARTTTRRFWKSPSESSSSSSSGSGSSAKAYYYRGDRRVTSCGNGVRINPVINVPAPFIPRGGSSGSSNNSSSGGRTSTSRRSSFFAYLLCSCGEKKKMEI